MHIRGNIFDLNAGHDFKLAPNWRQNLHYGVDSEYQAIRLLRRAELEDDYTAAWEEWDGSADREAWEGTVGDGWA